ncbi:hypothetical protein AURDEDRAFT_176737 [Auricularia subglabra TFB-10046 SS5]|uniref:Uncharacterized protein n=1 Tax=Auricularia subglabra (strain TFB-10046 / SS5) TaxID=717982 RepID=J0LCG4_AURST|nr:hypothetical protein AURDEDRAFT_176737 [Auricularia subglabra TFB-10046 SS5]
MCSTWLTIPNAVDRTGALQLPPNGSTSSMTATRLSTSSQKSTARTPTQSRIIPRQPAVFGSPDPFHSMDRFDSFSLASPQHSPTSPTSLRTSLRYYGIHSRTAGRTNAESGLELVDT